MRKMDPAVCIVWMQKNCDRVSARIAKQSVIARYLLSISNRLRSFTAEPSGYSLTSPMA